MTAPGDRSAERLLQYPSYEVPLLSWYEGIYDSVFVAFHPFVRLATDAPVDAAAGHLSRVVERSHGRKVAWPEVAAAAGLADGAAVNNALLTRIMAIAPRYQTPAAAWLLETYLQANRVSPPDEGLFSPLMEPDILAAFDLAGEDVLTAVDEFAETTVRRSRRELGAPDVGLDPVLDPINARGAIFPPSRRFLVTVDWDSFFTLICGSRVFVASLVDRQRLDGFFCDRATRHFWSLASE